MSPILGIIMAFLMEDVEMAANSKCYGRLDGGEAFLTWTGSIFASGLGFMIGGLVGIIKWIKEFSFSDLFNGPIMSMVGALVEGVFLFTLAGGVFAWFATFAFISDFFC